MSSIPLLLLLKATFSTSRRPGYLKVAAALKPAERSLLLPLSDRTLRQRQCLLPGYRRLPPFSCIRQPPGRQTSSDPRRCRAGDCFFLDCSGEYTHISSEADPWELLWIHFYGPNAAAYYSCFREQHDWHFKSSHLAELTSTIQNVITLHEEKTDDADLLTAAQIVSILTTLCTDAPRESADDSPLSVKLKDIFRYLNEHYTENISLDQLADQFYISKYYLSREFKKEFGTTIIQYLLTKKITNAKELLRYSNDSIETIAQHCGIDDASYFNKVFKKIEGCTASEYRRRW